MTMFSAIASIRIEAEDMVSAIKEIEEYLMDNDYLCHLHYIVEEAENPNQSDGGMMTKRKRKTRLRTKTVRRWA